MINIFSTRMINATGFVQRVFDVFSRNGISVDIITTSEANISVTVAGGQDTSALEEELSQFASVNIDNTKSQVSVIGKNVVNHGNLLQRVVNSLSGFNVHMISQGASNINVSFVIDRAALSDVVNSIHKNLF